MADEKPIIVVKKKGHHGGHHGGAWKVAYADFVTAMMAFFMVMWLVNTADTSTKKAIAVYFRKPGVFTTGSGAPLMVGGTGIVLENLTSKAQTTAERYTGNLQTPIPQAQSTPVFNPKPFVVTGTDEEPDENVDSESKKLVEIAKEKLKKKFEDLTTNNPDLKSIIGDIEVTVEPDGLKVEILDSDKTSMFQEGSARITPEAEAGLKKIAEIVNQVDFPIDIIGHTDARPFSIKYNTYTNWELSADRANAARRFLEESGVRADRVSRVIGLADRDLKTSADPLGPANRRITMKLRVPTESSLAIKKFVQDSVPTPLPEHHNTGTVDRDERRIKKDKIFSDAPVIGPANLF